MKPISQNYLVTGGAGFIGSNLVAELVRLGHRVTVVDNLHTGNLANLNGIMDKISFKELTIGSDPLPIGKYDGIYHLGMASSSPMYKTNKKFISEVVDGAIDLYEYAIKNNIKIVYASTSSLYNGNEVPFSEDMQIYPTDFYTEARNMVERLAEVNGQIYGLKAIGLRLFSVYGPNEEYKKNYANLVSQFLWEALHDEKPVIYGDGKQSRDFTYVTDVVKAFRLAMESKTVNHGVYNIGTGRAYTLNEAIDIMSTLLGFKVKPTYIKNPINNYVSRTLANTIKAEVRLGFEAQIGLEDGIRKLVHLYTEQKLPPSF